MNKKHHEKLAKDIRAILVNAASERGDIHLAASLGIVELMLALFDVYDFEKDKFILDIGHQRSPYLMLREMKKSGVLKFPHDDEKYDMFCYPGFAGLSIASALGFALTNPDHKAIALIGDGSLTCGEIYESLNHVGELRSNILVILNQNEMSISPNVGALYDGTKARQFFESLNFEYIGLLDGYDIPTLSTTLALIKNKKHPVLLHVKTQKGKGYWMSEKEPTRFHNPFYPFNQETGELQIKPITWKEIFLKAMGTFEEHAAIYTKKYQNVYFTTPATPGLAKLRALCPERVLDTGINEQHCMTLSTTLATLGNKVIMSMAAIFLSRCYSQIFDLCHQNAPLSVVINLPGVTPYGSTHQSVYAIALLKNVPNSTVMHPVNIDEFKMMMDFCIEIEKPIFLQMTKENPKCRTNLPSIKYGKGYRLTMGDILTVLPIGSMFDWSFQIAEEYDGVEIINPRFIKPFDYELLFDSIAKTGKLLILEDGLKAGGLGEEIISEICLKKIKCSVELVAAKSFFPDIAHVDYEGLQKEYDLTLNVARHAAQRLLRCKSVQLHCVDSGKIANFG